MSPRGDDGRGKPGPGGDDRIWGLTFGRWVAAACGLHVVAGLLLYDPTLFPGGDNAGYMILGEALRTGTGYVDLHLPDAPVHTKYPPLYPGVLAVLGWLGGLQLFKLASLAMTTGSVALTSLLGRRWSGPRTGILAGLLLALNPVLLDYSHFVLSEAPFVLLVLAALWAADRAGSGPAGSEAGTGPGDEGDDDPEPVSGTAHHPRWQAVALAAGAAAFLTRTAGLPLLLALAAVPALRRRRAAAAAAAAAAVAVAGGWALFQRLGAPDQAGYLQQLLMVNPYDPAAGSVGPSGLLRRTAENFWSYVAAVLPRSLTGIRGGTGAAAAVGGVAVAALAAWGWMRRSLREVGVGELFLFLYLGTVAAWPSVWTDRRFLLPVVPLLLIYALHGGRALAARVSAGDGPARDAGGAGPGRGRPAPAGWWAVGLALLLGAGGAWSLGRTAPDRLRCLAAYRAGNPCVAPPQASFYAAARWARDHTPPDAVVVNRKPRIFYWISGRRGTLYPYSSEPDVVVSGLEDAGASFVVLDAISGTTARYLVPAVEAHRRRFQVVYREGRPPTWILRFTPPVGTASRPAAPPDGRRARAPAGPDVRTGAG